MIISSCIQQNEVTLAYKIWNHNLEKWSGMLKVLGREHNPEG